MSTSKTGLTAVNKSSSKPTRAKPRPRDPRAKDGVGLGDATAAETHLQAIKVVLSDGSLDEHKVTDLMLQCASSLAFMRTSALQARDDQTSMAGYCYMRAASGGDVSVWGNGFKVGVCTEQEAISRGLRPCG